MMHLWVSSFGIASAFLLIAAYVFLRWQQNRHQLELAKLSLERGYGLALSESVAWLDALRRAVGATAVGLGLVIAGGLIWYNASATPMPEENYTAIELSQAEPTSPQPSAGGHNRPKPFKPRPSPQLEVWDRAQQRISFGMYCVVAGSGLLSLGVVGIVFCMLEKRFYRESTSISPDNQ